MEKTPPWMGTNLMNHIPEGTTMAPVTPGKVLEPGTFRIPEPNMPMLEEAFAKLAKKAIKLGMPVPTFEVSEDKEIVPFVNRKFDPPRDEVRVYYTIQVAGIEPKIGGYTLIAALDHGSEHGNIVRGYAEVPVQYYTAKGNCDHCGFNRNRKKTIILRDDSTGEYVQIGRQCVRDYIGWGNPEAIASIFEHLWDACLSAGDEEGDTWGGRYIPTYELTEFVGLAYAAIRVRGWVPSRQNEDWAPKESTKDAVLNHYHPKPNRYESLADILLPFTQEDMDKGKEAVLWAQSLPQDPGNQYLWNLRLLSFDGTCKSRTAGLAASMAQAYRKHLNEVEEKKAKAFKPPSQWVGVEGEKGRMFSDIRCVFSLAVESSFGPCFVNKFEDPEGNILVWFTGQSFEVDSVYTLKGSVKRHSEYKCQKQTELTRCRVK